MPQVFDKVNMRIDSIPWDFKQYTPDVVTITLGQNDGIQDSVAFCSDYVVVPQKKG
jgi:lysophospholipase L1-like esterase